MRFSKRTGWDTAESAFAATVRRTRDAGRDLLDLTVSNPTMCGFDYGDVVEELGAPGGLVYRADPLGLLEARAAVCEYYVGHGAVVDPAQVVLTASTSEGYAWLFRLLCDTGDEVLAPSPGYPLFDYLADIEDVTLRTYPLFYDYGWWIDFDTLERRIGPRTRAIVVVHPANPTGHWTQAVERRQLVELCARRGLALIVDEVFLDYPVGAAGPGSFAAGAAECLMFVLSGLSKVTALPQMKVGWIVARGPGSEEAMRRLEVIADTFLSVGGPVQGAMARWLGRRLEIQEQILGRVRGNLGVLAVSGLEFVPVEAGWSIVARLPGSAGGAEEVLERRGVVVHPGSFYGLTGRGRVVVSLLGPAGLFAQGVGLLVE